MGEGWRPLFSILDKSSKHSIYAVNGYSVDGCYKSSEHYGAGGEDHVFNFSVKYCVYAW